MLEFFQKIAFWIWCQMMLKKKMRGSPLVLSSKLIASIGRPEVCVKRWKIVILEYLKSLRYFWTGSSNFNFPSCASSSTSMAVNDLVIDPMANRVSGAMGTLCSQSDIPYPLHKAIFPFFASNTAPLNSPCCSSCERSWAAFWQDLQHWYAAFQTKRNQKYKAITQLNLDTSS